MRNSPFRIAGITIPAILIGEEGRGRERGVVPVGNPPMVPCPERGKDIYSPADKCGRCGAALGEVREDARTFSRTRNHPDAGIVRGRLMFAEVGQTKAGKPKFISRPAAASNEKVIVVFRTTIGFRGGNSHAGDKYFIPCPRRGQVVSGHYRCPDCNMELLPTEGSTSEQFWAGSIHPDSGEQDKWHPFPGEILVRGAIAEGIAGRAGSGGQLIAPMPKDVVFRTAYSGRLYGAPSAHYYLWSGERLLAATWEERTVADLF